jgi:FkbM family methyltransferase
VKLKELFYGLGLRPKAREYPYKIITYDLPVDGEISFALWQHPGERKRERAGRAIRVTQAMVNAVRGFLRPGDVAIDIGAHMGDSTLPIALAAGPKGAVFALEPNPYVFRVLLANAALNRHKTNIYPLNFAAAPADGEYEFEYSDPGFCNGGLHEGISRWRHAHFFKLNVTGRNLPSYLSQNHSEELNRLRYVKIDTEGFDRSVAASLRELFVEYRPYLKTEMYKHTPEEERRGYFRDLRELGYALYKVRDDETDYPDMPLRESDLMNWSHFDVFGVPEK